MAKKYKYTAKSCVKAWDETGDPELMARAELYKAAKRHVKAFEADIPDDEIAREARNTEEFDSEQALIEAAQRLAEVQSALKAEFSRGGRGMDRKVRQPL